MFLGPVRVQSHRLNIPQTVTTARTTTTTVTPVTAKRLKPVKDGSHPSLTTECANLSVNADTVRTHSDSTVNRNGQNNTLLQMITNHHYQHYATALTITIGVGCFLLLLNFFIFTGIYRQRESTSQGKVKKKRKMDVDGPTDHHLIEGKFLDPMPIRYNEPSTSFVDIERDLSLKEFEATTHLTNTKSTSTECSPTHATASAFENDSDNTDESPSIVISPSIPEPPPPPKNLPPSCYQGVRKVHSAQSTLPSTKKRVQIQEISV